MYTEQRRDFMKITATSVLFSGLFFDSLAAAQNVPKKNYRAVPANKAQILQDGKAKMYCPICGMTLPLFYKTNHAANMYGKTHQYCSIHCMFEHAMTEKKEVMNPQVVNNETLKFIKSEDAYYVVGSKKPATMSMISKYAFGTEEAANSFAAEFGGSVKRYDAVAAEVQAGLKKDIAMIQKRQAKAAKMGEKVYKKMCKSTDKRFKTAAEAKVFLKENNLCGRMKGKPLQQVGLFLAGK